MPHMDKAFWTLLLGILSYESNQITTEVKEMRLSVQKLNENMAIVMGSIQVQDKQLEMHSSEILSLKKDVRNILNHKR